MTGIVKDFLEQAHRLDRDTFMARHLEPFLIRRKDESSADPRSEYSPTLKLKYNQETREVRIEPLPPSPLDLVISLTKTDRNPFAGKVLLGRTETNDIVVPHITVSKHHAFFRFDPDAGRYSLTDTHSTNGTKLNSQALHPKQPRYLSDGDQVAFGDVKFTYYSPGGLHDLLRSLSALR